MLGGNTNEILYKKISNMEDKLISFMLETRTKYKNFYTVIIERTAEEKSIHFYAEGEISISFAKVVEPFAIKLDDYPMKAITIEDMATVVYKADGGKHTLLVTPTADPSYDVEGEAPLLPFGVQLLISGNLLAILG